MERKDLHGLQPEDVGNEQRLVAGHLRSLTAQMDSTDLSSHAELAHSFGTEMSEFDRGEISSHGKK